MATFTQNIGSLSPTSVYTWHQATSVTWVCSGTSTGADAQYIDCSIIPIGANIVSAHLDYTADSGVNMSLYDGSSRYGNVSDSTIISFLNEGKRMPRIYATYKAPVPSGEKSSPSPQSSTKYARNITLTIEYEAGAKTTTVAYGTANGWVVCNCYYGKDGEWQPVEAYYGQSGEWKKTNHTP